MMHSQDLEASDGLPIAHDPVCGMRVEKALAVSSVVFEQKKVFFCSDSCRATFARDPEHYLANQSSIGANA